MKYKQAALNFEYFRINPRPDLRHDEETRRLLHELRVHQIISAVKTLEETERNQILKILSDTRWHIEGKDGAAAILGLHPSTLRARMHKLGILRPETKESN